MNSKELTEQEDLVRKPTEHETFVGGIAEKLSDMDTPGFEVEFDPEEAEFAGAFIEDALSEEEARESAIDLTEVER